MATSQNMAELVLTVEVQCIGVDASGARCTRTKQVPNNAPCPPLRCYLHEACPARKLDDKAATELSLGRTDIASSDESSGEDDYPEGSGAERSMCGRIVSGMGAGLRLLSRGWSPNLFLAVSMWGSMFLALVGYLSDDLRCYIAACVLFFSGSFCCCGMCLQYWLCDDRGCWDLQRIMSAVGTYVRRKY
jgi:hypothetical protein